MRNPIAALLLLFALTLSTTELRAEERWTLRLAPTVFDTNAEFVEDFPDIETTNRASVEGGVGLSASLERSFGRQWGLEAGLLVSRLPATLEIRRRGMSFRSEDDLQVESPFLMFNWHPRREGRFSPFVGLGAAYTRFGDVRFFGDERVESDGDFGWLAQLGAEIRLKGKARLFAAAMLLDTTYQGRRSDDTEGGVELDVELRGLRVGLAIALGGTK